MYKTIEQKIIRQINYLYTDSCFKVMNLHPFEIVIYSPYHEIKYQSAEIKFMIPKNHIEADTIQCMVNRNDIYCANKLYDIIKANMCRYRCVYTKAVIVKLKNDFIKKQSNDSLREIKQALRLN